MATVWNLEERKLHTVIRDAHDAPVTRLHFFPGEPRLMSAGTVSACWPAHNCCDLLSCGMLDLALLLVKRCSAG